jgi:hypothetical protein
MLHDSNEIKCPNCPSWHPVTRLAVVDTSTAQDQLQFLCGGLPRE